jgi:hypothetical protein
MLGFTHIIEYICTLTGETNFMEDNNDLNMSLFQDSDLELNIDSIPEEFLQDTEEESEENITQENTAEEETAADDMPADLAETLNEPGEDSNESPEEVAREDEDEGGDDENSPNLYSSLANVLHEQGLLPSLNLQENEIKNADDISAAVRNEIDSNVKAKLIETLGEDGYEAVTSGIPLEQLAQHRESQLTLDSISEESLSEDIELSKKVIYQDYINQGIPAERANKLLQRITAAGDEALLEDAKESLTSVKTFEQAKLKQQAEANKQRQLEQAKQQEEEDKKLKNTIYNSSELIKGLKLNKALQDRIYNSITTNVGEGNNFETKLIQDRKANPVEFDAKLYYLYEVTNGFKDFSNVLKTTRSSAVSDLEKSIKATKKYDNSNPLFTQDSDSYFGSDDIELVL